MIVAGYRLPFFPMRPTQGTVLDSDRIKLAIQRLIDGWTVQLKLNGDRAIVAVDESKRVFVFNRHGSKYKMTVDNLEKFQAMPSSVFDGEIYGKEFYPFEALAVGGQRVIEVADRENVAMNACQLLELNGFTK